MTSNKNEKELQNKLETYFSKNFNVSSEVWSEDNKFRIDIILIHKSDTKKDFPFGIEVKIDNKKTGKQIALWLKQAVNYSKQKFKGVGQCIILTAPQLSYDYFTEGSKISKHENSTMPQHSNINTFLGQFNIGEVMKLERWNNSTHKKEMTICFVFSGQVIYEFNNDFLDINKLKKIKK